MNKTQQKFSINKFTKNTLLNQIRSSGDIKSSEVRKCIETISHFVYLLYNGEKLNQTEVLDTFFSITKLFKFTDPLLRMFCYLAVRELNPDSSSAIAIYNFVIKDMGDKNENISSAAFKVVCSIYEKDLFQSANMIRSFRQSIENHSSTSTCHALAVLHELIGLNPEIAKSVQSSIRQIYKQSNNKVMQYHAAGLMYKINMRDNGTVQQNIIDNRAAFQHTICYNIKVALKLLKQNIYTEKNRDLYQFIIRNTSNKKKMVVLEASSALIEFFKHKNSSSIEEESKIKEIKLIIPAIFNYLTYSEPALKFMALKIVNKAIEITQEMSTKNMDILQGLLTDANRCVVTLSLNALLKVCPESNVDKLMKKLSGMMQEIPDQFRSIVIESIKSVSRKFVRTHKSLMKFLTQMFRNQSGLKCKGAIVNAINDMIHENPSSRESGLLHLCELIEDCDHSCITIRILHLLAVEAPNTPNPFRFIQYIYNRITLDIPRVRAAAVSTLACIGMSCIDLSQTIVTILGRLFIDLNDEIRDRATFYHHLLKSTFYYKSLKLNIKLEPLRFALMQYHSDPSLADEPFNITTFRQSLPLDSHVEKDKSLHTDSSDIYEEHCRIYEGIGEVIKTCDQIISLSDDDSDFVVKCHKLVYSNYICFVFEVNNTLSDVGIGDVFVEMTPSHETLYRVVKQTKADIIEGNSSVMCSTLFSLPNDEYNSAEFRCCLRFGICEDCTVGSPERYELEKTKINFGDFVCSSQLGCDFKSAWDELGEENGCVEVFNLPGQRRIRDGIDLLLTFYGLTPFEGSEKIVNEQKMSHTLMMAGRMKGYDLLAVAKLVIESGDEGNQIIVELSARSHNLDVADIFINLLYS